MNGNRADQGGAASAGRKSVGRTSIPAQRRAVKAIPVDDVEQIARGCKGDSSWNSDALILCEDVASALRRKVPALWGIPLLEVEGIVKDTIHQKIEDALRDVISCAVEAIIGAVDVLARALMRDSRGRPETPLGVALAHIVETEEERR